MLDLFLRFLVDADVVRDVAAGPQHDLRLHPELRRRELLGHDVVPRGAGAGEDRPLTTEASLFAQPPQRLHRAAEESRESPLPRTSTPSYIFDPGERDRVRPPCDRVEHFLFLERIADAGASADRAEVEEDVQRLPGVVEEFAQLIDVGRRVHEAEQLEVGGVQQLRHEAEIRATDDLVRDEHARDAMPVRHERLMRVGDGDPPRTGVHLPAEQLGRHRGLAVRRELHAVLLHEVAHPGDVVRESLLVEHRGGERDLLVEQVPPDAERLLRLEGRRDRAHALVQRAQSEGDGVVVVDRHGRRSRREREVGD